MNMRLLSENALQRGSYPWERDACGAVGDYTQLLQSLASAENLLKSRFDDLADSLARHSSAIRDGKSPTWASFLDVLLPQTKSPIDPDFLSAFMEVGLVHEAYAFPFIHAAQRFYFYSQSVCSDLTQSEENTRAVSFDITTHYLRRLIETSRFVLHVEFVDSGLKYSEWCEQFNFSARELNPWIAISEQYPILLRNLYETERNCSLAFSELLTRFRTDLKAISTELCIPSGSSIVEIKMGLSDPHRKGRSVAILGFGNERRVVYKPKPLDIDAALYRLLDEVGGAAGVKPLRVIPRDDYGWVEYVGHKRTSTTPTVAREIGGASALFWLLNSTDLHSENIFASNQGVYALDLETLLLAPRFAGEPYSKEIWRNHSLYTTMLFDFSFGEAVKQNISGFDPSDNLTVIAPKIEFRIENDCVSALLVKPRDTMPVYSGDSANKLSYIEDLIAGFDDFLSQQNADKLEAFLLSLDPNIKSRIVFRDTYFYDRILDKVRQPKNLRDGAAVYTDLWKLHFGVLNVSGSQNEIQLLVEDEILQLMEGDIPYFSCCVGKTSLHTSTNEIENFFLLSGRENALRKLRGFEFSDVCEQQTLIQVALRSWRPPGLRSPQLEPEPVLTTLREMAQSIIDSAFCPKHSLSRWVSMFGDVAGQESRVSIGDKGFFSGTLGILLALQAVDYVLRLEGLTDSKLQEFLDQQAKHLEQYLAMSHAYRLQRLLGLSGVGGELFSYSTLNLMDPKRWCFLYLATRQTLEFVKVDQVNSDKWLDIIGGSAGFIAGTSSNSFAKSDNHILESISRTRSLCSVHLVNNARRFGRGSAWVVPNEKLPLVGFAHGCMGVASVLALVGAECEQDQARRLLYERLEQTTVFMSDLLASNGSWFDYRGGMSKPLNRSWCNGSPGILRGLSSIEMFWDDRIEVEFSSMLDDIKNSVGNSNIHRFCCGEMGNVDFLLDLARIGDTAERSNIWRCTSEISKKILVDALTEQSEFIPERVFPGLFHGQAGILYTAARFFAPELPSLTGHILSESPANRW